MTNIAKNAVPAFGIDAILTGAIFTDMNLHDLDATPLFFQLESDLALRHPLHQMLQAVESRTWNLGTLLYVPAR